MKNTEQPLPMFQTIFGIIQISHWIQADWGCSFIRPKVHLIKTHLNRHQKPIPIIPSMMLIEQHLIGFHNCGHVRLPKCFPAMRAPVSSTCRWSFSATAVCLTCQWPAAGVRQTNKLLWIQFANKASSSFFAIVSCFQGKWDSHQSVLKNGTYTDIVHDHEWILAGFVGFLITALSFNAKVEQKNEDEWYQRGLRNLAKKFIPRESLK